MHTSLAKIVQHITETQLLDELHDRKPVDPEERNTVVESLTDVAHFVIDDRIVALASDKKVEDSVKSMVAAGIRALPFDPMLLEFRDIDKSEGARSFVRLQTRQLRPIKEKFEGDVYAYVYCMMYRTDGTIMVLSLRPGVPIPIKFNNEIGFTAGVTYHENPDFKDERKATEHLGMTAVCAMLVAMIMLNTRGVITERVSMHRLNKQRAKKGKSKLNDYTVVRIGHIYDSAGNAHSVEHSGRHMPVHWRIAHVRNVRYGPYSEPAKHRPVLIPGCLVNYDPATEDAKPLPHREVHM